MLSGVRPRQIRANALQDADWHRLAQAADVLQGLGGKLMVSQRRGKRTIAGSQTSGRAADSTP